MDLFEINGRHKLEGTITISGAKNAALPIIAATLLTDQPCVIHNIPHVRDIQTMLHLMSHFGSSITNSKKLTLLNQDIHSWDAPYDIVKTMRASSLVLGPLLARCGRAHVSLPGGCAIGARPMNLHLGALEKMGTKISIEDGYITAIASRLQGNHINFEQVTVTGTENIMMAAVLAKGQTVIDNAALEPEVVDVGNMLIQMGARIHGLGTNRIIIDGCETLRGVEYSVISDRIEAGTFILAAAITGCELTIMNCRADHLQALIEKLTEAGVLFTEVESGLRVTPPSRLKAVDMTTAPYPGFATDHQAQFMAAMTLAEGCSCITETIFENRFMHVAELGRMGANITVKGNRAIIKGINELKGAPVMATDLRASASLVLAALAAHGTSEISRVYHIDRGYEDIEKKLLGIGVDIRRVKKNN